MGNRVVPGKQEVDDKANEKLDAVGASIMDFISYYESNTDEGAPVWRNLPLETHARILEMSTKLSDIADAPYREKFVQGEHRRQDIVTMDIKQFARKWGNTVAMLFLGHYNRYKAKYSNNRTQYNHTSIENLVQ